MSKVTKLKRLIAIERGYDSRGGELSTEQANLRAWWAALDEGARNRLIKSLEVEDRKPQGKSTGRRPGSARHTGIPRNGGKAA
jgi:hypothetical protein